MHMIVQQPAGSLWIPVPIWQNETGYPTGRSPSTNLSLRYKGRMSY